MTASTAPTRHPRPPAVAGTFYPGDAATLARDVDDALASARAPAGAAPKALIAPHAGYVYSGPVAASAYAALEPVRDRVRRVVLLGPCHRVAVRGLALPTADAFDTPLGRVPVDRSAAAALAGLPQVVVSAAAHAQEHSLEVQLPFLQRMLGEFAIVPLAVGDATADEVADVLDRLWGGPETLILVSSDLSHYQRYDDAVRTDRATAGAILALDPTLDHEQACGATPIAGLLTIARRRGLIAELLDLRNSGDTAGDRRRVVGYAAFAFRERDADAGADDDSGRGPELIRIARGSIREAFGLVSWPRPAAPWLAEPGATFVTLRQGEALRGCIGSLEPRRALGEDVAANARAAAFADPRFPPLRRQELDVTSIEVSLLSPSQPIAFASAEELFAKVVPGADGIVLEAGTRRATFLPQVWDALPHPREFFGELARKAGLPASHPIERCRVLRYRVRKWSEAEDPR